jgi:hypothetical protein
MKLWLTALSQMIFRERQQAVGVPVVQADAGVCHSPLVRSWPRRRFCPASCQMISSYRRFCEIARVLAPGGGIVLLDYVLSAIPIRRRHSADRTGIHDLQTSSPRTSFCSRCCSSSVRTARTRSKGRRSRRQP